VQTISLPKAEYLKRDESILLGFATPSLLNEYFGETDVLVSIKFREAQNCPDSA